MHLFSICLLSLMTVNGFSDCFDGEKLELSESEWAKQLTPDQLKVLRQYGTERPFQNLYYDNEEEGIYTCAGCDLPLYSSEAKYDSGTGWPSFWEPICPENVHYTGLEVSCSRCRGHLGHVFNDGPEPTRLRYCMNSAALQFIPNNPQN